jgi:hypothetical protein
MTSTSSEFIYRKLKGITVQELLKSLLNGSSEPYYKLWNRRNKPFCCNKNKNKSSAQTPLTPKTQRKYMGCLHKVLEQCGISQDMHVVDALRKIKVTPPNRENHHQETLATHNHLIDAFNCLLDQCPCLANDPPSKIKIALKLKPLIEPLSVVGLDTKEMNKIYANLSSKSEPINLVEPENKSEFKSETEIKFPIQKPIELQRNHHHKNTNTNLILVGLCAIPLAFQFVQLYYNNVMSGLPICH